jgi:threonine dehydratase
MIEKTRNLVEPAGAAALAAVLGAPERFAGRKVAIICSGGNISPAQLAELWSHEPGATESPTCVNRTMRTQKRAARLQGRTARDRGGAQAA